MMNHLFQITVYTSQQLVLEALQRWLQRPCESDQQRARRKGIKGLIILLLKTAATGVLATILDAAIEYRRRQLLLAASETSERTESDPDDTGMASLLSPLSLGRISRSGISAWKSRLLVAIDELEKQAEQYGIEPTHRFTPSKLNDRQDDGKGEVEMNDESGLSEARQAALAKTIEQLQGLVKSGGEDAEGKIEQGVDALIDSLFSDEMEHNAAFENSTLSAETVDNKAWQRHKSDIVCSSSCTRLSNSHGDETDNEQWEDDSTGQRPVSDANLVNSPQLCYICMDHSTKVQVLGCRHELCFQCARKLCDVAEHCFPQCPFCRQPIDGFAASQCIADNRNPTDALQL